MQIENEEDCTMPWCMSTFENWIASLKSREHFNPESCDCRCPRAAILHPKILECIKKLEAQYEELRVVHGVTARLKTQVDAVAKRVEPREPVASQAFLEGLSHRVMELDLGGET